MVDNLEAQPRPRFVIRDAAFALEPQAPMEWVIDGLISAGSVSVFYGEPGSKKTYSLLSLAVCAAAGKDWLEFNVKAPFPVLFIDEESGEKRFTIRLGLALRGELAGAETPIKFISLAGFHLDDKNDPTILHTKIIETGAKVVIFDALADIMTGDENSKEDTQPVLNELRKLAESTGAAIIVIHHSNRNGGYRGTSAIKGSVDLFVKVESEDGSKFINFSSEKNRDGEPLKFSAVATWTDDQFYLSEMELREKPKTRPGSETYVIELLKKKGPTSMTAIMDQADICSPAAAKAAVYRLAKEAIIHRTNKGGKGEEAIYDLSSSNNE